LQTKTRKKFGNINKRSFENINKNKTKTTKRNDDNDDKWTIQKL
jgi:hypothetical protein